MAMGLLGGLSGLGMSNSYCHMCSSLYCMHTVQGVAAQQQMSQQQYDSMIRQYAGQAQQLSIASSGTVSVTSGSTHVMQEAIPKNTRRNKILLLRRPI